MLKLWSTYIFDFSLYTYTCALIYMCVEGHFCPFKILFLVVSGIDHRALNMLGKSIAELHLNTTPWGKELRMELLQLWVERKSIFLIFNSVYFSFYCLLKLLFLNDRLDNRLFCNLLMFNLIYFTPSLWLKHGFCVIIGIAWLLQICQALHMLTNSSVLNKKIK